MLITHALLTLKSQIKKLFTYTELFKLVQTDGVVKVVGWWTFTVRSLRLTRVLFPKVSGQIQILVFKVSGQIQIVVFIVL